MSRARLKPPLYEAFLRQRPTLGALEPYVYLIFCGVCTLLAAQAFFDARALHLGWANAARLAKAAGADVLRLPAVAWSAPLDDTFIHFDFARAFANLRPFEWSPGNGYSSGATSWLYPAVLAIGILLGFDGQSLGSFADLLACTSVFAFLWLCRALLLPFSRATSYLLPLVILSSGVLGWSLWSGMELSLFLAIWATTAKFSLEIGKATSALELRTAQRGFLVASTLLVMTRPEALYCVGLFALFACHKSAMPEERPYLNRVMLLVGPAVALTLTRAFINLVLTGSFADAGALVKLETLHPFHEPREVALRWLSHVGFQFLRITVYHTSSSPIWGFQIWVLSLIGFLPRRTRKTTLLLVLSALGWILIVAQNEYVRYQNDRYTMPALTFLLLAVVVGVSGVTAAASDAIKNRDFLGPEVASAVAAGTLLLSFLAEQAPRLSQQKWMFGRACRNIAEQQIRVGQLLGAGHFGTTSRVLLGDAGAIPFFSGIRALDAIGLGGTYGLPFAKAVRLGVGATIELIEHLDKNDRPDKMAIYPSWWDLLPVWFGEPIEEVRISGNVVCGAVNKVIYRADWRGLDHSATPFSLPSDARIIDELDFADVLSESAHRYELSQKHSGYVVMKLLPHPKEPRHDLFDAGRLTFADTSERFLLHGFVPGRAVQLTFRTAPADVTNFRIRVDGRDLGQVSILNGRGWQESSFRIEGRFVRKTLRIELLGDGTERILYHLWATETP